MSPRAFRQFGAGIIKGHRLLIGTSGGHYFKRVGHGNDARTEGHLRSVQSFGISRSVETFMVFPSTTNPLAKPRPQGFEAPFTCSRMAFDDFPFGIRGTTRLIE
jgi:hypothetical protein